MTPEQVDKLIDFGQMALEQGWYDKARGYFEQALALDASNREAMKGLARVNEILGRKEATAVEPIQGEPVKPPRKVERKRSFPGKSTEKHMSDPELRAEGIGGQIELYRDKVRICRKGVLAQMSLKGDKDIIISTISSIQFKKAGLFSGGGFIQFSFMGGQEAKGGILQAAGDENTVMFTTQQQPDFEHIKAEIEKRIQAKSVPSTPSSDADEIAKLADLRDKGILTEEEFQQKKKQILGL